MKLVLDTNIFISGILSPEGNAGKILEEWRKQSLDVISSEALLNEIKQTLQYPKILKIIKWDMETLNQFIDLLYFFTTVVEIEGVEAEVPKDKNDEKILATYIAGNADYIITGDQDLLALKDKYKIITPKDFVSQFI